jgi:type VI protein secretion system component VasK
MSEEKESFEASNPVLGSLKVSSGNINTLFTLFSFVLLVLLCWTLWQHESQARDSDKTSTAAMVKSNSEVAQVLREFNTTTGEALKELTLAQRKTNCLLSLPPDQRGNADVICDRILRGR